VERIDGFVVSARGGKRWLADGETLELVRGDTLEIVGIVPSMGPERVTVNFKGFVGNRENNTGEDRGFRIHTDEKALMGRYALNKKGDLYEVLVTRNVDEKVIGRLLVRLLPAEVSYLLLRLDGGRIVGLRPGDNLSLAGVEAVCLEDVRTNLHREDRVCLRINGHTLKRGEKASVAKLRGSRRDLGPAAVVRNGSSVLGEVYLTAD
jgi:hypothetical protein